MPSKDIFASSQVGALPAPAALPAPTANQSSLVVDNSSNIQAQAIGTGLTGLIGIGAQFLNSKNKTATAKSLQGFTDRLLTVADGVDQGVISSQAGGMKFRSEFRKFIASNPKLAGEATTIFKDMVGTAGLAKVVDEGTEEEQRIIKNIAKATEEGFIPTQGASQKEIDKGLAAWDQANRATANLRALQRQVETNTANRALVKDKIRTSLGELADSGYAKIQNLTAELNRDVEGGKTTPEEAILSMRAQLADLDAKVNLVGDGEFNEYGKNITSSMKALAETYISKWDGSLSGELLDRRLQTLENRHTMALMNHSPEAARLVATVKHLGRNMPPQLAESMTSKYVDVLTNFVSGKPADILDDGDKNTKALDTHHKVTKGALQSLLTETDSQTKKDISAELTTTMNSYLKSVQKSGSLAESAKELKSAVQYIADVDIGKFITEQGGIDKPTLLAAKDVLQKQYANVVTPLIKKRLHDTTIRLVQGDKIGDRQAAIDFIEPMFSGPGVSFRLREGVKVSNFASKLELNSVVKDLNTNVAPVVNQLVRGGAHLSGHQKYKEVWENELAPRLFPTPEAIPQGEDELNVGPESKQAIVRDDIVSFLQQEEGFIEEAIIPTKGDVPTIGFGSTKGVKEGDTITKEEAVVRLEQEVEERLPEIHKAIPSFPKLPSSLQVALFGEWFRGSLVQSPRTRKLINQGKYSEAAFEFLDNDEYRNAIKRGRRGIRKRMELVASELLKAGDVQIGSPKFANIIGSPAGSL